MNGGQQRHPLLPDELTEEVLVRLPAKRLLRFKSVCESWHSLISNPRFVLRHAKLTNHRHHQVRDKQHADAALDRASLVFLEDPNNYKSCSLRPIIMGYSFDCDAPIVDTPPLPPPVLGSILIGSCNGLLCVQFDLLPPPGSIFCQRLIAAWNPITKVYRELPRPDFVGDYAQGPVPIKTYGFGYDESADDYKLVLFYGRDWVVVFSFKENSWRNHDLPFPPPHQFLQLEPGAFLGGALSWCGCARGVEFSPTSWAIVSFDLATDKFRAFPLPRRITDCLRSTDWNLGPSVTALQGRLCLFVHDAPSYLWFMKDYNGSVDLSSEAWTLVATIPYASPDRDIYKPKPLYLFKDDAALLVGGDTSIRFDVFDLRRNSLTHPRIRGVNASKTHRARSEAVIHLDTLVSPYGNGTPADDSGNGIAFRPW